MQIIENIPMQLLSKIPLPFTPPADTGTDTISGMTVRPDFRQVDALALRHKPEGLGNLAKLPAELREKIYVEVCLPRARGALPNLARASATILYELEPHLQRLDPDRLAHDAALIREVANVAIFESRLHALDRDQQSTPLRALGLNQLLEPDLYVKDEAIKLIRKEVEEIVKFDPSNQEWHGIEELSSHGIAARAWVNAEPDEREALVSRGAGRSMTREAIESRVVGHIQDWESLTRRDGEDHEQQAARLGLTTEKGKRQLKRQRSFFL